MYYCIQVIVSKYKYISFYITVIPTKSLGKHINIYYKKCVL